MNIKQTAILHDFEGGQAGFHTWNPASVPSRSLCLSIIGRGFTCLACWCSSGWLAAPSERVHGSMSGCLTKSPSTQDGLKEADILRGKTICSLDTVLHGVSSRFGMLLENPGPLGNQGCKQGGSTPCLTTVTPCGSH